MEKHKERKRLEECFLKKTPVFDQTAACLLFHAPTLRPVMPTDHTRQMGSYKLATSSKLDFNALPFVEPFTSQSKYKTIAYKVS